MITAKVVKDSICYTRITTLQLTYPRFIHSEFMTHRAFSRNASSSRAMPVEKTIQQVVENPAMPIHFGKNQPGMQAKESHSNPEEGRELWLEARDAAVSTADKMQRKGFHKQIVNRILEPFALIKVVVTATEWDNFFQLRLHPDAQPEMQALARAMWNVREYSFPQVLKIGDWHLPYTDSILEEDRKLSAARCARVSYNREGTGEEELSDKLIASRHASPLEHQATPQMGEYANFTDWQSYRNNIGI